ncbi:uncharacterized protein FA14DRAFT_151886 [Meira miltonrushii]|uniref:Dickkopf N-terminal cysteine-rich domain-containing protein n=1 Tax=Meira miltonrushii TaxID=1280837 RepID=A0A316VLL2_9BASI|nr:uncharacterized protein FA14DRAFT_151886 [Meira miltonrushii]PWN36435.1 hypothetical protein FA14DRAFT_151886 [Meira miltonrushii]
MKFIHTLFIALIFSTALLLQVQAASSAQASGVPTPPSNNAPNGSSCKKSSECESGNCMYSVCKQKQHDGAHCYKDASCYSGLCTSDKKSVNGKCVHPHSVWRGGKCKKDAQCVHGTFCSILEGDRCRTTFGRGHSCSRDSVCRSGLCRKRKCT